MVPRHPFLAQFTCIGAHFEGATEGRIHIDRRAAQSCELGTDVDLHRSAQVCKTAGTQVPATCPRVQGGEAGSNWKSTAAGRAGAARCHCTCSRMDVHSSSCGKCKTSVQLRPSLHACTQPSLLNLGLSSPVGKDCSLLHKRRTFSTEGPELSSTVSVLGRIKGSDAERGENISLIRCMDDMKMAEKKNIEEAEIQKRKNKTMFPYFGENNPRLQGEGMG